MGGGRLNEISAMEYIYGGPSIAASNRYYDLSRSSSVQEDVDSYHTPATVDMRLFPGGPAAATHSRTEPSVHPLLCGIDLPPVNSLVSDLLPHGTRAVSRAQPNRRPGDSSAGRSYSSSGFLLSAQVGNILRVNRPGDGNESAATRTATHGLHGWTEDGLSSEETVAGLSSAVEQAFIALMTERPNEEPAAEKSNEQPPEAETNAPPDHEEQAAEGGAPHAASGEQRRAKSDGFAAAGTQDTSSQGNEPSENEGLPSVASAEAN